MNRHESQPQRLLRLYNAMEASYRHLDRAQQLALQAEDLLNEAEAYRQRSRVLTSSTSAPHPHAAAVDEST